jgi:hypothetical protein
VTRVLFLRYGIAEELLFVAVGDLREPRPEHASEPISEMGFKTTDTACFLFAHIVSMDTSLVSRESPS